MPEVATVDGIQLVATVGVASAVGGAIVNGIRNIGGGVGWWDARREKQRAAREQRRAADLAFSRDLVDSLQEQLTEMSRLADQARDDERDTREQLAELRVWVKAATRLILMRRLTPDIDPPPGWAGGDNSWPTQPPCSNSS